MAFKGIDFSKLGAQTPEEREAAEAARLERHAQEDEKRRNELSKKSIVITLEGDPEFRSTAGGTQMTMLRGRDGQQRPVTLIYYAPDHISDEERRAKVEGLREGAILKVDGYWKKREWKDASNQPRSSWEFQAQRFETKAEGARRLQELARGPESAQAHLAAHHCNRSRDGR